MRFIYFFLTLLVFTTASSCKKFLDTEPTDFFAPTTYYTDEEHLNFGLAGVYDMLGSTKLYGAQLHSRHNFEADEGFYNSMAQVNGPSVHNYTANDPEIRDFWRYLYIGVTRANAFLQAIDRNTEIPESFRDRVRGETLFLRGYYYFLLVQNFGGVPLVLTPTTSPDDIDIPKSTEKEVYDQIIKDMEKAEGLVDPIQKIGFGGRVSKSAVRGILARVCLNMAGEPVKDISKFERASYWAKKVIDDTEAGHKLNPDFRDIFINYAADKYDYKESIWEVEFFGNNKDANQEAGYIGSWIGIRNGELNNKGFGFGRILTTGKLYRTYENDDLRRDWSIANFYYHATTGDKILLPNPAPKDLYTRYPGKYRREYEVVPKASQQTPINFPLLRYADILLMYAEAENEVNAGPTSDAYNAINLVRKRAFGHLLNNDDGNTSHDIPPGKGKFEFFKIIVNERSRELCFEGLRRADLIRWGMFVETMKETLAMMNDDLLLPADAWKSFTFKNASSRHVVYPTPTYELELNKMLIQHPLWR